MSAVARKPVKIYGVPFSVHTRKVMLAARLALLPFELVPVVPVRPDTLPADWRRISPTGLIPAIDDDGFRAQPPAIGALLRHWRRARSLSQLDLATQAEISSRHLCFVETGRAKPSREMVLLLADALDVPLRERNEWLLAAGFAPGFAESPLEAPSLSGVSQAIDAILAQQEPFPAVVMNRGWDIVRANAAAARFFGFLLGERREGAPNNVLRLFFHPDYVKPYVTNWEAVIRSLAQRARREALSSVASAVLEEVLSYPGVPSLSPAAEAAPPQPVLPVEFHKEGRTFRFFSAITTLGTPQDVTLQELRIESFFPSDEATRSAARELSGGA